MSEVEAYSYTVAALLVFPMLGILVCMCLPMKHKIVKGIYFGYVPLNVVACSYFGLTTELWKGMVIFIFCQFIQGVLLYMIWLFFTDIINTFKGAFKEGFDEYS